MRKLNKIPKLPITTDTRQDFVDTWIKNYNNILLESPMGIGKMELYDAINEIINEKKQMGYDIESLPNNLKKIETEEHIYFWFEKEKTIILGIDLFKAPRGLIVFLVGKNPKYRGNAPYASDLYNDILHNVHCGIRIMSDDQLSDEGYALWNRLFKEGHKISVYDKLNPGHTFKQFETLEELEKYYKINDFDFKRYQYILTEHLIDDIWTEFQIRKLRESIPGYLGEQR